MRCRKLSGERLIDERADLHQLHAAPVALIANAPGDEISLKKADNHWAEIKSGKVTYRIVGYPLLLDGTCWLLAVDFDKASWMDDVRAFSATCRRMEGPCQAR